ncbi:hypothetical protein AA313_de0206778 [Arthrobotrys entomopaga]|nr:hypothetical protein AA313_de0206778 [Arthrobotrys entomopaga]
MASNPRNGAIRKRQADPPRTYPLQQVNDFVKHHIDDGSLPNLRSKLQTLIKMADQTYPFDKRIQPTPNGLNQYYLARSIMQGIHDSIPLFEKYKPSDVDLRDATSTLFNYAKYAADGKVTIKPDYFDKRLQPRKQVSVWSAVDGLVRYLITTGHILQYPMSLFLWIFNARVNAARDIFQWSFDDVDALEEGFFRTSDYFHQIMKRVFMAYKKWEQLVTGFPEAEQVKQRLRGPVAGYVKFMKVWGDALLAAGEAMTDCEVTRLNDEQVDRVVTALAKFVCCEWEGEGDEGDYDEEDDDWEEDEEYDEDEEMEDKTTRANSMADESSVADANSAIGQLERPFIDEEF